MRLSDSKIKTFRRCARKYYYNYELGVVPVQEPKPFRMGKPLHTYRELVIKGHSQEDAVKSALSTWDDRPGWATEYDWGIERATMMAMLVAYAVHYADDALEHRVSELKLEKPLADGIDWVGIIDSLAMAPSEGVYVVDIKTTSEPIEDDSSPYFQRLEHDPQPTLYVWAARDEGYNVLGIMYDIVRKPDIEPCLVDIDDKGEDSDEPWIMEDETGTRAMTKKGTPRRVAGDGFTRLTRNESADEFYQRARDRMLADPHKYFKRKMLSRSLNDIDRVSREAVMTGATIQFYQEHEVWPKTTGWDCPRCQYYSVCHLEADAEDILKNQNFKQKEK